MTGLISRLTQLRHSDHAIAASVRETLVGSLYASPQSLVIGAITSSGMMGVVALVSGSRSMILCAVAILIVAGIRVSDAIGIWPRSARRGAATASQLADKEMLYRFGALSYSALLGVFGLLALVYTDEAVLQLLAVTTTIGYAAGIAGRNAGRPWIALSQLCFASLPLSFGLILSFDPLKIALAVVIMLFVVAMMDITLQTYGVILQATTVSREKVALAEYHAAVARRDDLTGVANRTAFREQFEARLRTLCTAERWLTIHWIDLDRFKEINDSFGHLAGNALLAGVARRLNEAFGSTGIVARLGGDEFAVLLQGSADPLRATAIAQRVIAAIEEPITVEHQIAHISASVGVMPSQVEHVSVPDLLAGADLALYDAKANGRAQVRLFTPELRQASNKRRGVAADLREAWDGLHFELYYQPQVALEDGRIVGAEALIRWNYPYVGVLSPATFLSVLEAGHLALPVGDWILRTACQDAMRLRNAGQADFRIGVNLFAAQLRAPGFVEEVENVLETTCLPASALELEITENIVLRNERLIEANLSRLRAMGVGIAFDDFGTGFASLTMLKTLPITRLKIDRSFIRDIETNEKDQGIVDAIVRMAQGCRLDVIAEGIETRGQADRLRGRVAEAQGYLFGKPMRLEAFEALCRAQSHRCEERLIA